MGRGPSTKHWRSKLEVAKARRVTVEKWGKFWPGSSPFIILSLGEEAAGTMLKDAIRQVAGRHGRKLNSEIEPGDELERTPRMKGDNKETMSL